MSLSLAVPQPLAYSDSRNLSWQKASNAARLRDQKSLKAIIASQYGLIVLSVLGAAGAVFLLVRDSRQAGEAKFAAFLLAAVRRLETSNLNGRLTLQPNSLVFQ